MKKIIISIITLFAMLSAGAVHKVSPLEGIDGIYFYGVDYSMCKTYGVEKDSLLLDRLASINNLFVTEPAKYNIERFTNKRLDGSNIFVGIEQTKKGDINQIATTNKAYQLDSNIVMQKIADLQIDEKNGTGLILFGEMLDKEEEIGVYKIVFFDIESRSIIRSWYRSGKAGGSEIRDYWAKTLYNAMKRMRRHRIIEETK